MAGMSSSVQPEAMVTVAMGVRDGRNVYPVCCSDGVGTRYGEVMWTPQ